MSFGFSIGDIIAVANLASKVRKRFVDAPGQFKAASDEVKGLSNVLRDVEDVFPERSFTATQAADLSDILRGCHRVLAELDGILDKYQELNDTAGRTGTGLAKKSRRFWKRLTFEPEDIKDLRSRLTARVSQLDLFMGSHAFRQSHLTKAGVDRLNKSQDDEKALEMINWLSDTNFPAQQVDFFRKCQEGTGKWLLDTTEFKSWLDGTNPSLFCPGIPGAGKTFLASIVINDLQERFGQNPDVGIACLYCNYKRQAEQTVENLIASLLKQIFQGRPDLYTEIQGLHGTHAQKGTRPSLGEISTALNNIILRLSRVFIIVDALDECMDPRVRSSLMGHVTAIRAREYSNVFATSRLLPEILSESNGMLSMEIRATEGDVRRYLNGHITELPTCVRGNISLQETIVTEIANAVDGMFLLAQLHLDSLCGKTTVKKVKIALQELPKGSEALDTAYKAAIERIETQKPDPQQLAKQVLSWVVYAARQLSMLELRYALAVEDGATELDEENLPEPEEIISVCAGLVTVDEDSDTVRPVHYTTQQYLERKLPSWAPHAELEITEKCLTYLSLDAFPGAPTSDDTDEDAIEGKYSRLCQAHRLLSYAVKYWRLHAESCWSVPVETMVLSFLERKSVMCWWAMLEGISLWNIPEQSTAMHFAAWSGSTILASALLRAGYNPHVDDSCGRTPLVYAVIQEQQSLVEWLLNLDGTDPNVTDNYGSTILHHAMRNRYMTVGGLLLERKDIKADQKDGNGCTPLQLACCRGNEGIVNLLIERSDVDVNSANNTSETPLLAALGYRNEAIARKLLERDDILINMKDSEGTTPLALAARSGFRQMVEILLGRKDIVLDPETLSCVFVYAPSFKENATSVINQLMERYNVQINVEYDDKTVLISAAHEGNTSVVKLLLGKPNIQVNCKDRRGFTALICAASSGCQDTSKLLLERSDCDVNCKEEEGKTALIWASSFGYTKVVKLLLERPTIEVNCKDEENRTALMSAASRGKEEVVKLLLEREEIEINSRDCANQTAFMLAASSGLQGTVKLLLERPTIGVNCKDIRNRTGLMLAATSGEEGVVRMLLERDDIEINCRDYRNGTPLILAAYYGRQAVVKLLLERPTIEVNCKDEYNCTALIFAAANGEEEVVRLLLERDDIKINCRDINGTALTFSAWNGYQDIVKLLLERPTIKVNYKDKKNRTALMLAAWYGREGVVRLLLERDDVEVNCRDSNRTALMLAAWNGYQDIVKLLLERPAIKVNCKDKYNLTALILAAANGEEEVVRLLLERDDVQINCRDHTDRTALMLAYEFGHKALVDILEQAGAEGEISDVGLREYNLINGDTTSMDTGGEDDLLRSEQNFTDEEGSD